jgi:hypothetical protein
MKKLTLISALLIFIFISCKNTEKTTTTENSAANNIESTEKNNDTKPAKEEPANAIDQNSLPEETQQIMEEKFTKLGFVKGIVTDYSSKSEGCGYMIEIEKNGEKIVLLPQNLDSQYQIDGLNVWIKYRPIKPYVLDCKTGIPAYIEAVQPLK